VIAQAGTVAGAPSFTSANFFGDVAMTKAQMGDHCRYEVLSDDAHTFAT
jgi:hypothetical protein